MASEPTADEAGEVEFLTADDLCDRWRTTPAHIKSLRLRGELGFVRVGRLTRFPLADVLAFEQRNTVRASA